MPISPLSLFRKRQSPEQLAPDAPLAVVGDIHGRADLLDRLLEILAREVGPDCALVFVGDYVDRGERSAEVLARLQALQGGERAGDCAGDWAGDWAGAVTCLKGNHEAMMLGFLDAPEDAGAFWIANGGAHTLASFGIDPPGPAPDALARARDGLRAALGPSGEAWVRGLPLSLRTGNLLVAHAGADPDRAPHDQTEDDLLWGHPAFEQRARRDGLWVAHGHTIREEPAAVAGRISVDTGAYATHRLTAAHIAPGACRFFST